MHCPYSDGNKAQGGNQPASSPPDQPMEAFFLQANYHQLVYSAPKDAP
jgi:hypothetical protein